MAAPPGDAERFRLELEFVQCLANPGYLHRAPPPTPRPLALPPFALRVHPSDPPTPAELGCSG